MLYQLSYAPTDRTALFSTLAVRASVVQRPANTRLTGQINKTEGFAFESYRRK